MFLGLKDKTKNESVRLISGIEPIKARWEKLKLLFVNRISQVPKNWLVRKIWEERKKVEDPQSLFSEIQEICKDVRLS